MINEGNRAYQNVRFSLFCVQRWILCLLQSFPYVVRHFENGAKQVWFEPAIGSRTRIYRSRFLDTKPQFISNKPAGLDFKWRGWRKEGQVVGVQHGDKISAAPFLAMATSYMEQKLVKTSLQTILKKI